MFHYDRNMVVAAYRAEHPDDLNPKEKTLTDFDADLFSIYEDELRKQALERGIPFNGFTRSMLVFFASRSTAKTVKVQVRHACIYFDSVRPQPSAVIGPVGLGPAPPPPSEEDDGRI